MLDKEDQVLAQLSLMIQLYYLNGGNDEGKQKALNIINKFKSSYPVESHFVAFKNRSFTEFTDKSYQSAYKQKTARVNRMKKQEPRSLVEVGDNEYG